MGSRQTLLFAVAALCLVSSSVWAATPAERGPYGIGVLHDDAVDASRGREIDLLILYLLTTATGDPVARYPLILFNHGFMLWGELYRSYGEQLASQGFVVALPTYAMSMVAISHSTLAADARFVIDHCLALATDVRSPLFGLVDAGAIGAAGHSFGGKLALLEAATDPRVRAIAALDPVDGGGPVINDPVLYPSVTPELMPEIQAPLLFVGAELGGLSDRLIPCAPQRTTISGSTRQPTPRPSRSRRSEPGADSMPIRAQPSFLQRAPQEPLRPSGFARLRRPI